MGDAALLYDPDDSELHDAATADKKTPDSNVNSRNPSKLDDDDHDEDEKREKFKAQLFVIQEKYEIVCVKLNP